MHKLSTPQTTGSPPSPRPVPFGVRRSTGSRFPPLREPEPVRPVPPTDSPTPKTPTTTTTERTPAMTHQHPTPRATHQTDDNPMNRDEPVTLDYARTPIRQVLDLEHVHDLDGTCRKRRSGPRCDQPAQHPAEGPYLCRHGKDVHEHTCDDHLDRARDERLGRYAQALGSSRVHWQVSALLSADELETAARAVMAVADAETVDLRAIVKAQGQNVSPMAYRDAMSRGDALQRRALKAELERDELRAEVERLRTEMGIDARGTTKAERMKGLAEHYRGELFAMEDRADTAERALAVERARVARAGELAAKWEDDADGYEGDGHRVEARVTKADARDLRAALAEPTTDEHIDDTDLCDRCGTRHATTDCPTAHGPSCVACANGVTEFHRSRTDKPNQLHTPAVPEEFPSVPRPTVGFDF